MTRKDYELIAAALRQAYAYCETDNQRCGVDRARLCLGRSLAQDNGRFDRARFDAACGAGIELRSCA